MKKTRLFVVLFLMLFALTGCKTSGNAPESAPGAEAVEQSPGSESAGVPDSVKQTLRSVLEQAPVAVPENGWTDEALLDVIYVNGKKLTVPFTLKDLGEGFDFLTDEENFLVKESGTGATLTYYGAYCGMCSTAEQATPENFAEQPLNMLTLNNLFGAESPELLPISVNGVTYQTSYDDVVARLGFTVEEDAKDPHDGDAFSVIGHTESYRLMIFGKNNLVNDITFNTQIPLKSTTAS